MFRSSQGSFHLFRIKGIDVYLHWSWFIVAIFEIQARKGSYRSVLWNVLEYVALFVIVLLHEFGHAFACRSVGGTADNIMLWPLGGVAYVNPPQRPGATLWSIAAGPLVNVALAVPLTAAWLMARSMQWRFSMPDVYRLIVAILFTDIVLLVFQYPPDLPIGWRPDPPFPALVPPGPRTQLNGRVVSGLLWSSRARRVSFSNSFRMDGADCRLCRDELLEWIQNRTRAAQPRKDPAPPGFCLSQLSNRSTRGPNLALQQMQYQFRHLRDRRRLSAMFRKV